ncbi:hypothetical protein BGX34_000243 [Mortierella sp. NVP85]|nr:hypothetical protein BGX34_000243 [Mortierella sp. NVP85]
MNEIETGSRRSIVNSWLCFFESLTIQIEHNLVGGCSPMFPAPVPTMIDHNKRNAECQHRVQTSTKVKIKVKKSFRRYSSDEKARIVEYRKNHPNMSYGKIAKKLSCSKTTVHRIIKGEDT